VRESFKEQVWVGGTGSFVPPRLSLLDDWFDRLGVNPEPGLTYYTTSPEYETEIESGGGAEVYL